MKLKTNYYTHTVLPALLLAGIIAASSCRKAQDDWLNVKRSNKDVVPATLKDFQAVLDQNNQMNKGYPEIALLGTDNSYVTDAVLNSVSQVERNSYIWAKDIFQGQASGDWTASYQIVESANIVLDGLQNVTVNAGKQADYNNVKGEALFFRAMAFYNLAQVFCKPYSTASAATDQGIPLRLSSDINIPSTRATVQATYDQILSDAQLAAGLLPVAQQFTTRPSQVAANALIAKTYLNMENYANAGNYADKTLTAYSTLLDYNSSLIVPTSTYRFPPFTTGNPEVIFFAYGGGYQTLWPNGVGNVDTLLYRSYATNDLRKTLFYKDNGNNKIYFFGGYTGPDAYDFAGIATDEIYLIRAECYARAGNTNAAMTDLNALLSKRWKTGTFVPYTATGSSDALKQVLAERRKELPFTALIRWEDLRRLNKDPLYQVTITHKYSGTTYTLPPNDNRYVYPIPDQEIQIYGLPQNTR